MKHIILFLLLISSTEIFAGGVVYLVLGSDTAIWEGMGTSTFNDFYNIELYTNPNRNTYAVMDPNFRAKLKDSYGQPLKLTWWMMAGNIFRYAKNKNMPIPNIMTLYLMKKYHGENIVINGDELTMHYHTFFWSDYDGDGIYYWNQAKTFWETLDDFKVTLSQFLLDEEVFPVSFRSGWHYMDNDWQHYLDERVLPYSLHNDYPAKRFTDIEPTGNIYDWSQAPSNWVPYRPSYLNYQKPGNGKGWNVRSASFQATKYWNYIDSIFAAASKGPDQVACLWAHLPEVDFLDNIIIIDSLAHQMKTKYPEVKFKYCTAVEAMQLWRSSEDKTKPLITLSEITVGDKVYFEVNSDEQIFQTQPFVAVKDIYENYKVADCAKNGTNNWITEKSFSKKNLVKVGATVCDTMGNQAMDFIEYLPEDTFLDNLDSQYSEVTSNWTNQSINSWGVDSRISNLNENDSAVAMWNHTISQSTYYNLFVQIPKINNPVSIYNYIIYLNSVPIDTVNFSKIMEPLNWNYLTTISGSENDVLTVKYRANGKGQTTKYAITDVLKISALVKEKELSLAESILNLDEIVIGDTVNYTLTISNYGTRSLKIFGLNSLKKSLISKFSFPIEIPQMGSVDLNLKFKFNELGNFTDSLLILSDDPLKDKFILPISANVQKYFALTDNEEKDKYTEFGIWNTSVATAHGTSSRYAIVNQNPACYAEFRTKLKKSGKYDILEIIPKTVNACEKAQYNITISNIKIDSVLFNQNEGSGGWKPIGTYDFPANVEIIVRVTDIGKSTSGFVLRADALKFQLVEELTDISDGTTSNKKLQYKLNQNYPNPFNPSTTISFTIPKSSNVKLEIFNLLGEKVNTLFNGFLSAGSHSKIWYGKNSEGRFASSGIYFYRIQADGFNSVKKMVYLR
ncbi:MAG: hypothetical protein COW71_00620 [Ignavibacteriales bacterium CG18_big_fil_WC_8_21_14_2_50_31_20]|nr:MAG: hypothetical protein COW71_00620 [Ignavibacteriales bacterium CG18_big_fil_WC_8_21_14_2_50_31_20]